VGKSTFQAILDVLHRFLEIGEERFVREVKPVFKSTVYFRDWCGYTPFHYPFDLPRLIPNSNASKLSERFFHLYDEVYRNPDYQTSNEAMVEQRKTPYSINTDGQLELYQSYAYHLNTRRFNTFLRDLCEERGISLINDRIETIHTEGNDITRIEGQDDVYDSDLYIDASGFNRVLRQELDGSFRDFELPLDSAFNMRVDRPLSDAVPATVIDTGEYGWFWQIDTFDDRDFGYVFASDYVSDEEALSEFLAHCGIRNPERDVRKYEFTSGYFEDAWVGNCIAVGNAEGFVEPLQSTALTASAQIASGLSTLLQAHDRINHEGIRDTFNGYVRSVWETIYDFIFIHYKHSSGSNEFWETMQSLEGSPRARQLIEEYNKNGLVTTVTPVNAAVNPVGSEQTIWNLVFFPLPAYYSIMRKMGAESEFYENNEFHVSDEVRNELTGMCESMQKDVELYLSLEEFYRML